MGIALEHLSQDQRREIAERLFSVSKHDQGRGELIGHCPLHEDESPSFSYNYQKDVFNCLGCGATGDLVWLWREVTGGDFSAFCEEHGIETGKGARKGSRRARTGQGGQKPNKTDSGSKQAKFVPEGEYERLKPLPESWLARLEQKRGWSRETIEVLGLRLGRSADRRENRVCIPLRDKQGRLLNIRQYLPGAKEYKILPWSIWEGKKKTSFGTNRLFPDPSAWAKGRIWVCEGEPDAICGISHGLNCVTQTAGAGSWAKAFSKHFRGRDVVICYDADDPGREGAQKAGAEIAAEAASVRVIEWPEFMAKGQDLTDFFVTHAKTVRDLEDLAAKARVMEPPPVQTGDNGHWRFFKEGASGKWSFKQALLVEELLRDFKVLSDPGSGLVYRYNGQFWERIHRASLAKAAIQKLGIEATDARANGAAAQAVILSGLDHGEEMNPDPELICLKNGMFNIVTGQISPHDPKHRVTYQLPLAFDPQKPADFPNWKLFLSQAVADPEVIDVLREFFGYCLTRHTLFERWLLLVGPRASGKSTALKVLRAMVGPENCSSVPLSGLEDQFQRASLFNKLVNLGSEVEGNAINSEILKQVASGDQIMASFKHQNPFEFEPFCKLVFAANKFPRVRDNSSGFFGKVLPVRFDNGLSPEERDPLLLDKLLEELPGIFGWAWTGLVELTDRGYFRLPKAVEAVLGDYKMENSLVAAFLDERCELDPAATTSKADLYKAYEAWADDSGIKRPLSINRFSAEVKEAMPALEEKKVREGGKRVKSWVGLRRILF